MWNSATELESSCKQHWFIFKQLLLRSLRATWLWLTVNEQGYWHSVVFLFHRRRHKNQMHVRIARSTDKNQTRKSHDRCCQRRTCQQQSTITPFCWKAFEVLEVLPTCHQRVNQCKWENHRTVKIRHHAFFLASLVLRSVQCTLIMAPTQHSTANGSIDRKVETGSVHLENNSPPPEGGDLSTMQCRALQSDHLSPNNYADCQHFGNIWSPKPFLKV